MKARASVEDRNRISDILDEIDEDFSDQRHTPTPSNLEVDTQSSQGSVDVGNADFFERHETEGLDLLDEDLHSRDEARATGFVGKSSEIQWLRTVALAQGERIDGDWPGAVPQRQHAYASGSDQVSSFSFWVDSDDVSIDFYVNAYELPQPELAEHLVQCYMLKVHDSFPILPRKAFGDQTRAYFAALRSGNAPRLNPKWQAILNLVFAIGANYAYLLNKDWDGGDHIIYQARARAFGMSEAAMTSHPDVPQIQGLGLLAFYWLSTGQVSRAWTVVGAALRSAYSLGLHVRNEDPSATATKRESLVKTWWSLYSLERTLSIITGRPSIVVDSCCSVPLPMSVPEEDASEALEPAYRMHAGIPATLHSPAFPLSPNLAANPSHTAIGPGTTDISSVSYFRAVVQLSIITQSVLTSLYSAGTMIRSSDDIQRDIALLDQRLDQWARSLPPEFRLYEAPREPDAFGRERMLLRFQLCSAQILLTRPCLTVRRQPWKDGNDISFSKRMADNCVGAARTIVASLPEESYTQLYEQSPWWCLIHHMMQAISVFLLALSHPNSTSFDTTMMIHCIRKTIRWLQRMKGSVAERAHRVAFNCFESVARRHAVDISDLWNRTAAPVVRQPVSNTRVSVPAPVPSGAFGQAPTVIPAASAPAYGTTMTGATFPPHSEASNFDAGYYVPR
ncbi:fungal specific transcription factor domain containing protein [Pyrenophora tritici-repentis]|nr:fungal specific transcription factor domain-containing protein [Pyrenophora tritici-repentis]KAF7449667.1 fungal specific transcription factor domain containing protein [Pyrenophora tritici-repentis]KAF7570212.1 fungal specific transcription factor domain containing protein [Pyrenophora tritici-repentis]KAG9383405.1 fungal specific transcription factor domain containing protein [Pyrenophora tritici-repentis]KAI0574497.1 fungal specific transcription factor domain-containing protein [Pyrenoph